MSLVFSVPFEPNTDEIDNQNNNVLINEKTDPEFIISENLSNDKSAQNRIDIMPFIAEVERYFISAEQHLLYGMLHLDALESSLKKILRV